MKRFVSSALVFLIVSAVLGFGTCAALGVGWETFWAQRLLVGIVGGFGFLLTVLILLLLRYLELPEVSQAKGTRWMLSFLFPAASFVLLAVLIFVVQGISEMVLAVAIFGGVLVIANVAIVYLLRTMERQATHEFRNQLQTIHDLLARGAKEEALRYVEQLQGMQTTRVFAVNTHHPILDAVLNQKYQAAKELDVDFQFRVNDLSRLELETDALVVLFSNLLDNAVEGCARLPEGRMIRCSILLSDSLYISIRNTSPAVVMNGKEIPTTKEPKHEHGFGLVSVRRILEDLGAEYTFHYADGWFEFVAEIPLK